MKYIQLTQGKRVIVDDSDYEYINQWKWSYHLGYAVRTETNSAGTRQTVRLHRILMNASKGMEVDHKNHDKLDCRRANLRVCTVAENRRNATIRQDNTSGYKGVSYQKDRDNWMARIAVNNKEKNLGRFSTPEEAAQVYNNAAKQYFGEFAQLNPLPVLV